MTDTNKPWQPFGDDWRKALNKMSKAKLEQVFGVQGRGLMKSKHIDIIRANLIVARFNEMYPVGSSVLWKNLDLEHEPAMFLVVNSQAYLSHGRPVVFFNEMTSPCSIEPEHIVTELPF